MWRLSSIASMARSIGIEGYRETTSAEASVRCLSFMSCNFSVRSVVSMRNCVLFLMYVGEICINHVSCFLDELCTDGEWIVNSRGNWTRRDRGFMHFREDIERAE